MKTRNLTILGIASGLALSTGSLLAQTTAVTPPVGYRTETLQPGLFNLIGVNLENPVAASGDFEASGVNTLTDDEATYTTSLAGAGQYVVKITSGSGSGYSSVVTVTDDTNLASVDDLSTLVSAGDTYEVRASVTLSDAFGAMNEAGLAAGSGNSDGADIVWVPNGSGGFDQYFYNAVAGTGFGAITVGWRGLLTADADQAAAPIYFTDGVFVQRVGATALDVVFTGHVVTTPSEVAVENGFNFTSRILPVGVSLGDSGLENELAQGNTNADAADIIWIPNATGGYDQYFYNGTAGTGFGAIGVGWKGILTADADQSAVELSSGFVIERKGAATSATFIIPSGLDL